MGFCRRCGEIVPVQAARCKCGGSAVAPVVHWGQFQRDGGSPDRWVKTYVSTKADEKCPPVSSNVPPKTVERPSVISRSPTKSARRFPRPLSNIGPNLTLTDSRVSHHIASATTQPSPPPTKNSVTSFLRGSPESTPADVITSPDNTTLAKAYGSILQRPDTLPIHACARCSSIFPPDATIYPDPRTLPGTTPSFLCRSCFATQGGSKGNCDSCGREVLTAVTEGGFIENAGRIWHNRCFRCEGCHEDISRVPMVDLYGKPSCSKCFDGRSDTKNSPKKRQLQEPANNMGGLRYGSRESSPALEELSERLGIKRQISQNDNRSPPPGERNDIPPYMNTPTASREDSDHLPDRLRNWLRSETPPPKDNVLGSFRKSPGSLGTVTTSPVIRAEPSTPDSSSSSGSLSSSAGSTLTISPRKSSASSPRDSIVHITRKLPTPLAIPTTGDGKCSQCLQSLFRNSGDGKIVTVPPDSATGFPSLYHASCFRCFVCGDIFDGNERGKAMFAKDSRGVCHPECKTSDINIPSRPRSTARPVTASEYVTEQPLKSAPPFSQNLPRFGGSKACPGCCRSVSLMEYGVVPGPQSSRWHVGCLVCGGKGAKLPRPGCGKKLDSGAKMDYEGNVWCRECMLLLPAGTCGSPQGSPTRGVRTSSYTDIRLDRADTGRLFGQVTGSSYGRTTDILARHYTGGGVSLMRGGSVSPTRQMSRSVSPIKGLIPVTRHTRPAGSWKHKSVDEGRGMFLVKQMTGC